jgi:hypothetical protein
VQAPAILNAPGWFIDNAPPIDGLTARNPNQVLPYLNSLPPAIAPAQVRRIIHQLEQRSTSADK